MQGFDHLSSIALLCWIYTPNKAYGNSCYCVHLLSWVSGPGYPMPGCDIACSCGRGVQSILSQSTSINLSWYSEGQLSIFKKRHSPVQSRVNTSYPVACPLRGHESCIVICTGWATRLYTQSCDSDCVGKCIQYPTRTS